MIPYLGDIDEDDLLNYWGQGAVLLQNGGAWHAYGLSDVDMMADTHLVLTLQYAAEGHHPPQHVKITKEKFFKQVILHRPALGPVIDHDKCRVVHLSWIAAKGDKIKSILDSDIHVRALADAQRPRSKKEPVDFVTLEQQQVEAKILHDIMQRQRTEPEYILGDRQRRLVRAGFGRVVAKVFTMEQDAFINGLRPPVRGTNIKLLLRYLNTKPLPLWEAYDYACTERTACMATNNVWLLWEHDDVCSVWLGTTRMGLYQYNSARSGYTYTPAQCDSEAKQASMVASLNAVLPLFKEGTKHVR